MTDEQLTEREREVLELRAHGLSYREIAAELGVSIVTVKKHVERTYEKLGVHTLVDALRVVGRLT